MSQTKVVQSTPNQKLYKQFYDKHMARIAQSPNGIVEDRFDRNGFHVRQIFSAVKSEDTQNDLLISQIVRMKPGYSPEAKVIDSNLIKTFNKSVFDHNGKLVRAFSRHSLVDGSIRKIDEPELTTTRTTEIKHFPGRIIRRVQENSSRRFCNPYGKPRLMWTDLNTKTEYFLDNNGRLKHWKKRAIQTNTVPYTQLGELSKVIRKLFTDKMSKMLYQVREYDLSITGQPDKLAASYTNRNGNIKYRQYVKHPEDLI